MKKLLLTIIFIVTLFTMSGCNTAAHNDQAIEELKVEGDFKVTIQRNEQGGMQATITYIGEMAEVTISHAGSIFFFNIYQLDGDYESLGHMELPSLSTTLDKGIPHIV